MDDSLRLAHVAAGTYLLLLFSFQLIEGSAAADYVAYDHSHTIECLAKPKAAQYEGGIIVNPGFEKGLQGWYNYGAVKLEERVADGNRFAVAHTRGSAFDSMSQKIRLEKGMKYIFSAWVQLDRGNATVTAIFRTLADGKYPYVGHVAAKSGCWSMLKGGFSPKSSGVAELYFESKDTEKEIWVDNLSLQPFTEEAWRAHHTESIEKVRKSKTRIHVADSQGKKPLLGAKVILQQKGSDFPIGAAINKNILNNAAYQTWYTSRPFTVTTFENEMKWYATEASRGTDDYSHADALMAFAKNHRLRVRGHNVFWEDPRYQTSWVSSLSADDLKQAAEKRINSVMNKYKGQVIAWDVVNENMHFNFFESKLGHTASAGYYSEASKLDPATNLFLNDYNTLEDPRDPDSTPAKYLEKIAEIKRFPGSARLRLAIGLEGHFGTVPADAAYIRSALDTLAKANLPIWITELDVKSVPNQEAELEKIMREVYAHPAVNGIILWVPWNPQGCYAMCLTDNNFKNLPTGDVVDKLLKEWKGSRLEGVTDGNGQVELLANHGDYEVTVINPITNSTSVSTLKVATDYGRSGTSNALVVHA